MPEMILKTASLLLGLFCLLFCVRRRREVYFPLPRGLSAWLKNRHAAYLAMLGALTASAIASLAEGLMADAPRWLGAAYLALQAVLLLAFAHYAVALFSRGYPGAARGRDRAAFMLLALIAAVGVALRAIWDIRVELFFEALALFGCAVLLEQDEAPSARREPMPGNRRDPRGRADPACGHRHERHAHPQLLQRAERGDRQHPA